MAGDGEDALGGLCATKRAGKASKGWVVPKKSKGALENSLSRASADA